MDAKPTNDTSANPLTTPQRHSDNGIGEKAPVPPFWYRQPENYQIDSFQTGDGYRHHFVYYPANRSSISAKASVPSSMTQSELPVLGTMVMIHGIQSHAGWYGQSCQFFQQQGYEVYFLDRRGSGMNAEQRGDAATGRQLQADLLYFLNHVRTRHPHLPTHLMAISWGGKLAVTALTTHWRFAGLPAPATLVQRLLLICPGWFSRVRLALIKKVAIAWYRLVQPHRLFRIPLTNPELFTAQSAALTYLQKDSQSLTHGTSRLLLTSFWLDRLLRRRVLRLQIPSLLILAGKDQIIDNAKTKALFEKAQLPLGKVLEYPEAHHTIEFEPDAERIFVDWLRWLQC